MWFKAARCIGSLKNKKRSKKNCFFFLFGKNFQHKHIGKTLKLLILHLQPVRRLLDVYGESETPSTQHRRQRLLRSSVSLHHRWTGKPQPGLPSREDCCKQSDPEQFKLSVGHNGCKSVRGVGNPVHVWYTRA